MKKFFLIIAAICFFSSKSISQSRMEIFIKGKKCDILGYTMDPDATGDKQSISILGAMQSAQAILQMSYLAATPIDNVQLFISAPDADNTLIKFKSITVYAIKEYLSSYANGAFSIASSGNANIEMKCKFTQMIIEQGPSVKEPVITNVRVNNEPLNIPQASRILESNEKWEITGGGISRKGNSGNSYMFVRVPANTEFDILIYQKKPGTNDSLIYSSHSQNIFPLPPGNYLVNMFGVKIYDTPIRFNDSTRIKAGVLNITSPVGWNIMDSGMHVTITAGSGPSKLVYPVGIYQLKNGGQLHQIEIKDGQTFDFSDAGQPATQQYNTDTHAMWDMQPDPTIKGVGGEITMQIPNKLGGRTHMEFYIAGDTKNRLASWFGNNNAKLLPGLYDIVVDGRYTINNVPVELGKQTRLKMGVFSISGYGSSPVIENSNTHQKFTYSPPFTILLPEGTYYLNGNKKYPIVIKDGQLTEL